MKKNLLKKLALVLAGAMIFSATACSSGEETTETAPETAETTVAVGMMASVYPYAFLDDNDNIVGYDVDMLTEMDKRMDDYTFTFENLQFAVLFESLDTGAVDMLTGSINRTPEREEKYMTPQVDSGANVCSIVVADSVTDVNGIDDLGGKTVAFDPTRAEFPTLTAWNEANPDNPMVIQEMNDPTQADLMKLVADGRIDATLIYRDSFPEIQKELNLPVKMLDEPTCKLPFTQLISDQMEGNTEFCAAFEEALQSMIDDGTMSAISEKWVGFDMFAE
ncbi:MAG: transporter substrate-binding domain-containing protein [Firmicutes bacterium]|nr:transporter substrate-binding domain-containing protein [Bacillota bacterium]